MRSKKLFCTLLAKFRAAIRARQRFTGACRPNSSDSVGTARHRHFVGRRGRSSGNKPVALPTLRLERSRASATCLLP